MTACATSLLLPLPLACLQRVSSAPPFPTGQFQALLQGTQAQGGSMGANALRSQSPRLAPGGQASKPGNGQETVGARVHYWSTPNSRQPDEGLFAP